MLEGLVFVVRLVLAGLGATLVLDLWSLLLKVSLGAPFPNYPMVGRWIGHFPRGQWAHGAIASAPPVGGERAIGWIAHYGIGILYAALLISFVGPDWLNAPTLLPALVVGIATVVAPFFLMQPAMGFGIASSKTPNPNAARLRSLAAHAMFGVGLYVSAVAAVFVERSL
jgi:hypothetical protein